VSIYGANEGETPRGRKPNPAVQKRRERGTRLRPQGLSMAEIGQRIGDARQATWELLSNYGQGRTPSGVITCCHCGKAITTGHDQLRNNGPVPCLECLARRPQTPFGLRLKAFRMAAGLTQEALAEATGILPANIRKYENNHVVPRWAKLVKLIRTLGGGLVTLGIADEDAAPFRPRKPR
jgi:DNA-binding XRE family transcriptional regulator